MEQVDITSPRTLTISSLLLNWTGQYIEIVLEGSNFEKQYIRYDGAVALNMMRALNIADLSAKSLHRRILERLAADGKLAGTISGTPD